MPSRVTTVQKVTDFPWVNLYQAHYRIKGQRGLWTYASRRHKRPSEKKSPDAVVIVPTLVTGKRRQLVLIKEFRVPIAGYEYHFPAGLVESEEDIIPAAKRELLQETGFQITKVKSISPVLFSSAGLSDESSVMVEVECRQKARPNREASEDITTVLVDHKRLRELLKGDGKQFAAKTWPYLLLYYERHCLT